MHRKISLAVVCGALLLGGAGCAVSDGQSSTGQYVDDATITSRVKASFAKDKEVSAMRINVETLNGLVQLSGFAASEAERQRAAELAGSVPNVKSVRNNILVRG
ncbi:MAG TPA: BON domain-containing protein [Methylibium sp.]|uniref:BON domain-containing protein n=1 Tax=Methylibium sp. TaxID=2067992 RepID=UPI002DB5A3D3|nr:BON domain-containing protein [Methylibium sp.]HEU4459101.1 BON domain-containing protein [Methylibium sp.]